MFKAILFDLDDTLLRNDMNNFVDAYWDTLLPKMLEIYPDHDIKTAVLQATQDMLLAKRSRKTLRQIFIETFESITQLEFAQVETIFLDYYQREYRDVQKVTKRVPGALDALYAAQALTQDVVLATVPIFPLVAIEERLRWAGIADFPFALITSFEMMHVSKPNPQYYEEIADLVGVEPNDCLMIGNDHQDDMVAEEASMKTFLVTDYEKREERQKYEPDYRGSLQDVTEFLKQQMRNS